MMVDAHLEAADDMHGKALAKYLMNPWNNDAGDFRPRSISKLGQHGSRDALLPIPADHIAVAQAVPQTREEPACDAGVDARAYPRRRRQIQQIHQQKEDGAT
jgi:hypothetical protein